MKVKLTDRNMKTRGGFQWKLGEWKETSGRDDLCSPGWLHYYDHPLIAVLMNPIHFGFDDPRMFEVEIDGEALDHYDLIACATRIRLVREIKAPEVSTTQRVAFAILCAKEVCDDPAWNKWADRWLSGDDRSKESANAAEAPNVAVEYEDVWVSPSATSAAIAARAAWTAYLATTKLAHTWAAYAVDTAASCKKINLIKIARKAVEYK